MKQVTMTVAEFNENFKNEIGSLNDLREEKLTFSVMEEAVSVFRQMRRSMAALTGATEEEIQSAPRFSSLGYIRAFDDEFRGFNAEYVAELQDGAQGYMRVPRSAVERIVNVLEVIALFSKEYVNETEDISGLEKMMVAILG